MEVVSPFVPKDRHVIIVNALTPGMQSSFEEMLAEPIPEAWLTLVRRLDRLDQKILQREHRTKR